jgi:cytochrome P450
VFGKNIGDIAHMMAGPLHQFLLVRPDDIHHVMVKNADNYMKLTSHAKLRAILGNGLLPTEGDTLWRRQRKLMQTDLYPNGIRQFADIMVDAGEQLTAKWHQKYADGKPFDLNLTMLEVTIEHYFALNVWH